VNDDQNNKKVYEKIIGKTRMSAHIYRFKGCISECFEPYLKSYSESEERKIIDAIESVMGSGDKLETIDYTVYSSSLHLFKNIKGSLKRCISFSTSKALFDLHISFKNVFRHYSKLLRRVIGKIGNENEKISLTDDKELKCCYVINTCEYCLETIPGLHNSITDKIDE
jgi:vacuolar protein sorting-associated protein 53